MKKKVLLGLLVAAMALPLSAETWKNVSLMDAGCAKKEKAMANPAAHKKSCSLQCAKAGFGAVVDGKFVKFDKKGDELALAALKKTDKVDNVRANVTGELKDGEIKVSSLTLE